MLELETYLTKDQVAPYKIWLQKLKDRHAVIRIVSRVERMAAGNYGDIKALGDGVLYWWGLTGAVQAVIEALLWPIATRVLLAPQRRPIDVDHNRPL